MKTRLSYIPTLLAVLFLAACGGNQQQEIAEPIEEETKESVCTYTLERKSTTVNWTAYKFEARTEVKGAMEEVKLSGGNENADTPANMLAGLSFKITSASVNSKDSLRDYKLANIFLGSMESTEFITGKITELKGADTKGTALLTLMMNGQEQSVEGKFEVTDTEVRLMADVNFEKWGAQESINQLAEACSEKHTDTDGVTKMWPDIKVVVIANYSKDCK